MSNMFNNAAAFDQDLSAWDVTSLTEASEMFDGSALSRASYDALLIGWESQDVHDDVPFSAGDTMYSPGNAAQARNRLIDEHGWSITDGGQFPLLNP